MSDREIYLEDEMVNHETTNYKNENTAREDKRAKSNFPELYKFIKSTGKISKF